MQQKIFRQIYVFIFLVESKWPGTYKAVQQGSNLGERMHNAFKKGFADGYDRIVLIGSDLPNISETHINSGLEKLLTQDIVFGPAEDGGYYLVGLNKMHAFVFKNKPWSQSNLFEKTVSELNAKGINFATLVTLNDIDTFKDLIASKFYQSNKVLQEKIKQLHD